MRKAFVAAMSMALFFGAATPALGQVPEPASASSASAFGIAASGLLPISPMPVVNVAQPPDSGQQLGTNFQATIPLDIGGLAVNGTITAVAEASRDPRLTSVLDGNPDGASARGFSRTDGLSLLGEADLLTVLGLDPLAPPALLSASAVEAEAVAACLNGQAVFSTDSRVLGLEVLELDLGAILDPVLVELLGLLNLPGILEVIQGESGVLPDGSGVFVNALRIRVLGTVEDIVIGHAEARMPADCRVPPAAAPPTAAPRGPGGALASTGSELPLLPLGLGIVALGVILNRAVRRTARRTTV
jgi:hypothetical protein